MRARSVPLHFLVCLGAILTAMPAASLSAQAADPPALAWVFRTNLFLTGNADNSTPPGYTVYSAIGFSVGLDRRIGHTLTAALNVRPESREVDWNPASGPRQREGSLETVATTLLLQFRPRSQGSPSPYVGVGGALTLAWEKTGTLDTLDVAPSFGPAVQAGLDFQLSTSALLNVNLGWNAQQLALDFGGQSVAQIDVDPLVLSVGVGFRF
jgi:outer membrane protein W